MQQLHPYFCTIRRCLGCGLGLVLALARPALASSPQQGDNASRLSRWTIEGGVQFAGLESYPLVGVSLGSLADAGRWQLGVQSHVYLPRASGDVRRFTGNLEGQARLNLLSRTRWRWYVAGGLGFAIFSDDFRQPSVFADRLEIAPGYSIGTGLQAVIGPRLRVLAEVRATSYWTRRITDDEWLEASLALQWRLGSRQ